MIVISIYWAVLTGAVALVALRAAPAEWLSHDWLRLVSVPALALLCARPATRGRDLRLDLARCRCGASVYLRVSLQRRGRRDVPLVEAMRLGPDDERTLRQIGSQSSSSAL